MTINEGLLRVSEENSIPVVLFAGNFNYNILGDKSEERLQNLHKIIQNCQSNLDSYKELVNNKFLSSRLDTQTLIPFGVPISPSV